MKSICKKYIIVGILSLLAILLLVVYSSNFFKFSSAITNSTSIVMIKREYDDEGNVKLQSKELNPAERIELFSEVKEQYIFLIGRTNGNYGLPYLPITEFEMYFKESNELEKTIKILENGFISSGYTIFYSFDSSKLFRLLDEFFDELK